MAICSAADWGGYVTGAEISGLDLVALALYISLPRGRHSLAFRFSMAFYFLATVISALQALAPVASLFYPWQLARMFLVYATIANGCADPRITWALMMRMAPPLTMPASHGPCTRFLPSSIFKT